MSELPELEVIELEVIWIKACTAAAGCYAIVGKEPFYSKAQAEKVVYRSNCHDDLVRACRETLSTLTDEREVGYFCKEIAMFKAGLAKVRK